MNGVVTTNTYNPKGLLIKTKKTTTDNVDYISLFDYDRSNRKIAEVSPKNYIYTGTLLITDMDRTVFTYDNMDRVKTKTEIYHEKHIDTATFAWTPEVVVSLVVKAYKYDAGGNVIKELDGEGYKYGVGTTADDKINSGYGTEYKYSLAGQVTSALDAVSKEKGLNFTTKYEYDGVGRKLSETAADGSIQSFTYDDSGKILATAVQKSEGSPEQTIKTNTYNLAGYQVTTTDGNGNTTKYEYNALGKLRKTIYPGDKTIAENTVTLQYDVMGNVIKQQDSMGKVILSNYDNEGKVLSTTEQGTDDKNSITTTFAYDISGNKRFETDPNGTTKENIYNQLNRLIETKIPVTIEGVKTIQSTKFEYDKNGNQTKITDWMNNYSENRYDPLNRLIEKIDPNQKSIQRLEYNASHVQIKAWDALNNPTQFFYDRDNRLIATIDQENHVTAQSYDDSGNVSSKTDGNKNITTYKYDQFDRLLAVTNAKGETTSYTYDLCGNMLAQTDGKDNSLMFEYNAMNKLVKRIDAGGRTGSSDKYVYTNSKIESYTYLANGSMDTKLDRNGKTTKYTYDIHGRLLKQAVYVIPTDTKTVLGMGTNTYKYDIISGVAGVTIDPGNSAEITTDIKGNKTIKINDKLGRLYQVIADGQTTTYEYNDTGSRKKVTYTNTATQAVIASEEYFYYNDNTLSTLTNKKADGSVMDIYSYIYDANHNQLSKTETVNGVAKGQTNYAYDELNRLQKVTEPNTNITEYTYDEAGNRLSETLTVGATITITNYYYNEQNRLISTEKVKTDGSRELSVYSYDNNGNLTRKASESTRIIDPANPPKAKFPMFIEGEAAANPNVPANIASGTASYEYDVWNQMVKAVTGAGTTVNKYNGDGLRVEKSVNGVTTKYVYESDKSVLEVDSNGKETGRNVYGINLVSRRIDAGQSLSYLYNGHADVTALIDVTGVIAASYYYDAFGNPDDATKQNALKNVKKSITYAGYQWDNETGLYYLNARMYDSKIARFMQEDDHKYGNINDPLSLNYYTYVSNNPITYTDPTGHWQQGDEKLSIEVQAKIAELTSDYQNAKTKAEKDKIHNLANAYRTGSILVVNTVNSKDLNADVKAIMSDKNVSQAVKNSLLTSTIGAVYKGTDKIDNKVASSINNEIKSNQQEVIQAFDLLNNLQEANNSYKSAISTNNNLNLFMGQNNSLSYLPQIAYNNVLKTEVALALNDASSGNLNISKKIQGQLFRNKTIYKLWYSLYNCFKI